MRPERRARCAHAVQELSPGVLVSAPDSDVAELMAHLYLCEGLSTYRIGERTGIGRQRVGRLLTRAGVAVKPRGAGRQRRRDESQVVLEGGPIWQRFPVPVSVTPQLAEELYVRCGLGVRHIELLTGQPSQTLLRLLEANGVTRRPAGGRTPFMRRWRAGSRAVSRPQDRVSLAKRAD